ncbi:SAM-dependent methyltransferase [Nonomuraea sp. NPDC050556]|uniref:SAM-dependent methyltransferase n=1 Tax=Nonomuraea sp. NPDC050556 TaxID=3364369 RepID=UPI003791053C
MNSQRAPEGVDPNVPNVARMYDYYLDGKDNFAADRAAAERILKLFPDTRDSAKENRAFLRRAVRYLSATGIRQIVDLGSGLPTQGNTHENAPEAQVVYVDYDPVVAAHGRALLASSNVHVIQADIRDTDALLKQLDGLIDLAEPVAFLLLGVLYFLPDAEAYPVVERLREVSAPGSHLAISHAVDTTPDRTPEALAIYRQATASLTLRTEAEIARFFDGYDLVEPGLVYPKAWRPDAELLIGEPETSIGYAGVGRKP